jgi:beta-xylosidase
MKRFPLQKRLVAFMLVCGTATAVAAADPAVELYRGAERTGPPNFSSSELDIRVPRERLQPLFQAPIRDTSICRGDDENWYLTGNHDADGDGDFQNNTAIHVWRSDNFQHWQPMGAVWDIDRDAIESASAWQKELRVNLDAPEGPLVRGITSPKIHSLKDTYWITYSMNGQGTGLLQSTSGKAEGPYTDLGRITEDGADASIFQDDDGAVYWVFGQGFIARMKPDLSGLAEAPRLIRPGFFPVGSGPYNDDIRDAGTQSPRTIGLAGAHLFKVEGRYWLTGALIRDRLGVNAYDTYVTGAERLDGPWTEPLLFCNHGGQTTVFEGPGGQLHATFSGRDSRAVFRDKPAAFPLIFDGSRLYAQSRVPPFPRKRFRLFTEFGPWAEMRLVAPYHIRDLQMSEGPEGWYYLTGSGTDSEYAGRIMLFRSRDMRDWEPVAVEFDLMSIPGVTEEDRALRFDDPKQIRSLGAKYMDSEIYHAEGTFHIFTSLYAIREVKKKDGGQPFSGGLWLRSTTGKPEGPYEYVDRSPSQNSAFQDYDGTWYIFFNGNLQQWFPRSDSLSGGRRISLQTDSGTRFCNGDVATNLAKIHGKYVVFATAWHGSPLGENYRVHGTYDWVYWQSETLEGPYTMPRRAYAIPHAGHSTQPIQGPNGRWYGLLFGNEDTGPWWNLPGVLVLDVRLDPDDTVRIEVKDELP